MSSQPAERRSVLVTGPLQAECEARLRAVADVTLWGPEPPSEWELQQAIGGHGAVVSLLTAPLTADVLAAAAGLELIAQVSVGLDNIDLAAARRAGVAVTHTPGVLTDATADLTLALLLATTRRLPEAERFLRSGKWAVWSLDLLTGLELRGATLGIVGMGRIGRAVAERAVAFGMDVVFCDPAEVAGPGTQLALAGLLAVSDVVSIHCPLDESTRGLLGRDELFAMKPGSYLINTARGGIVDEDALAEALERGPLIGAGLDVHTHEPRVHPELLERDDVVLLPHIGSATEATRLRMARLAVESVEGWVRGEPLDRRAV